MQPTAQAVGTKAESVKSRVAAKEERKMTPEEIANTLNAYIGKRLRITFDDAVVQSVEISSVDEEGFLHSGPDGSDPDGFWTRFEGVVSIEQENQTEKLPETDQ